MNNNTLIIAAVTAFALAPFIGKAQENKRIPMTQEQRERMLAATGGPIMTPEQGPWISIVKAPSKLADGLFDAEVARIKDIFKFPVHVSSSTNQWRKAGMDAVAAGAAFSVIVGNCDCCDSSLVLLPSDQVALVNLNALEDGSAEILAERFHKELVRAVALTFGLGYGTGSNTLLKPIKSLKELDALQGAALGPESMSVSMRLAKERGMNMQRKVPYKMAVMQGWAPAPTNDYQKAIWEKIKAKTEAAAKPAEAAEAK